MEAPINTPRALAVPALPQLIATTLACTRARTSHTRTLTFYRWIPGYVVRARRETRMWLADRRHRLPCTVPTGPLRSHRRLGRRDVHAAHAAPHTHGMHVLSRYVAPARLSPGLPNDALTVTVVVALAWCPLSTSCLALRSSFLVMCCVGRGTRASPSDRPQAQVRRAPDLRELQSSRARVRVRACVSASCPPPLRVLALSVLPRDLTAASSSLHAVPVDTTRSRACRIALMQRRAEVRRERSSIGRRAKSAVEVEVAREEEREDETATSPRGTPPRPRTTCIPYAADYPRNHQHQPPPPSPPRVPAASATTTAIFG